MSPEDPEGNDAFESLIARYLDAEKSGHSLDREALIIEHPELADSLREFFANHDGMKAAANIDDPTLPPNGSGLHERMMPPSPRSQNDVTISPQPVVNDPTIRQADSTGKPGATVGDHVRYFGDYELLEEIARGGMGVVFKARQVNLNRIVALKMILAGQFAGQEDVQRFYTEAEAAANLDHTGIVPIFEIGEHERQHYFSMGYIEGESLAHKVADGPLPPQEASDLVSKICDAMAYAHERGVIHRDLKPANILIDRNGQPKVTDFGLAKKTQADSNLTGTGQILGTPAYMPPEQASGNMDNVGPHADVYSLGAILYCLLTGRPPFQASSPMDTLLQVLGQEPVAPRQLNPSVPVDLETICLKCLSKEARSRYTTSEDLGADLRRFLNGEPILARPVGQLESGWLWCKRNPAIAVATGFAVSFLILGSAFSIYFAIDAEREAAIARSAQGLAERRGFEAIANSKLAERKANEALTAKTLAEAETERANKNADEARAEKERADQERDNAVAHEAVAKEKEAEALKAKKLSDVNLYVTSMNLVSLAAERGDRKGVRELLENYLPEDGQPDVRDLAWWYWWQRLAPGIQVVEQPRDNSTLLTTTWNIGAIAFSSDSRRLAIGINSSGSAMMCRGELLVIDLTDGNRRPMVANHIGDICSLAFSADGKTLASGSGNHSASGARDCTIKLWNPDTGGLVQTLAAQSSPVRQMAWSPDSQKLLWRAGKSLKIFDTESNEIAFEATDSSTDITRMALTSDGSKFAVAKDATIDLWDISEERAGYSFSADSPSSLAFLSGDQLLGIVNSQGQTIIWNIEKRAMESSSNVTDGDQQVLAGLSLPTIESKGEGDLHLVEPTTGNSLATWIGRQATNPISIVSPNEEYLAYASADNSVHYVAIGKLVQERTTRNSIYNPRRSAQVGLSFSADGNRLLITRGSGDSNASAIETVDLRNGELLQIPPDVRGSLGEFSPTTPFVATGFHRGSRIQLSRELPFEKLFEIYPEIVKTKSIKFSPDGSRLAITGPNRQQGAKYQDPLPEDEVIIWDLLRHRELCRLEKPTQLISTVAFSPDSKYVLTAGIQDLDMTSLFLAGNGSGSGELRLWDATTGRHIKGFSTTSLVSDACFSPRGPLVATANWDETIRIYNMEDGSSESLRGHSSRVTTVCFSHDGNSLVSGSSDNTLRFWSLPAMRETTALRFENYPQKVAVNQNGSFLAIDTGDMTTVIPIRDVSSDNWSPPPQLGSELARDGIFRGIEARKRLDHAISLVSQGSPSDDGKPAQQRTKEEAIAAFEEAINLDPDNPRLYANMGRCFYVAGEFQQAEELLVRALRLFEKECDELGSQNSKTALARCYYDCASVARSLNRPSRGHDLLHQSERLINSIPRLRRSASDWECLGMVHFRLEEYANARTDFNQAIRHRRETRPTRSSGPCWWYLVMTVHHLNEPEKAKLYYSQLIESPDPRSTWGESRLRNEVERLIGYTSSEGEKPDTVIRLQRANALMQDGKFDEAIKQYRASIETLPTASAHFGLAKALRGVAKFDEARKEYRNVLQLLKVEVGGAPLERPNSPHGIRLSVAGVYMSLAEMERDAGNSQEEWSTWETLAQILEMSPEPEDPVYWGVLGQALYNIDRIKDARTAMENTIELRGEKTPTIERGPRWWYLTMSLAKSGETDRARHYYDVLVEQLGDNPTETQKRLRGETAVALGLEGE